MLVQNCMLLRLQGRSGGCQLGTTASSRGEMSIYSAVARGGPPPQFFFRKE